VLTIENNNKYNQKHFKVITNADTIVSGNEINPSISDLQMSYRDRNYIDGSETKQKKNIKINKKIPLFGYSGANTIRKKNTSNFDALDLSGQENYKDILSKVKVA
jgi:hypothetical protein